MNYKWLILGGCPRSGTTLLNFVLNSHPAIRLSNEQNLYRTLRIMETCFYREEHVLTRSPRKLSKNEAPVGAYENEVANSTIKKEKSLYPAIKALYSSSLLSGLSDEGQYIVGDKYPKYYRWDLERLSEILESVAIIHVTRSPLDVVKSCVHRTQMAIKGNDWWPIRPTAEYLNEWIYAWNFAVNNSTRENFIHIKYEDFLENPEMVTNMISSFLGLTNQFDFSKVVSKQRSESVEKYKVYDLVVKHLPSDIVDWNKDLETLSKEIGVINYVNSTDYLESLLRLFQRKRRQVKNL